MLKTAKITTLNLKKTNIKKQLCSTKYTFFFFLFFFSLVKHLTQNMTCFLNYCLTKNAPTVIISFLR